MQELRFNPLCTMVIVQTIRTLFFLFSSKLLVFRAGIHKMLVKIANREDLDQTAS